MSGAKSRRKGHDFEREFCRWVREEFGIEFGRNLKQYAKAQEGDTDPLGPYLPECKAHAKLSERAWWVQAVAQAKKRDLLPLLVMKVPHRGWVARVPHPWAADNSWALDFEYSVLLSPAGLALTVRERI